MYTEILPEIEEVLREQGVPPLWPGFLGQKDGVLIFSDLKVGHSRCYLYKNFRTVSEKSLIINGLISS